jgi:ribosomal protein S18 acetylase RimI-like enzyme/predicted enzyme related to lactoylglutathione lyase
MSSTAGLVVYALDPARTAAFYATVVGLETTERTENFVVLDSPALQLVVVRIAAEIAHEISLDDPPKRREDTPLKPLLPVRSLAEAREAARAAGGVVDAPDREWQFGGWRVCDGHDVEGNVFQVREPLGGRRVDDSPAAVRSFADDELPAFRQRSITSFVDALADAEGRSRDELRDRAAEQFDRRLPDGYATPNTWVLHVLDDDGRDVGLLWLGPQPGNPNVLYVNNVEIDADSRGRGYGRRAILRAEEIAREAGFDWVGLNVFGSNRAARALYDSLGYQTVATHMTKHVGTPTPSGTTQR